MLIREKPVLRRKNLCKKIQTPSPNGNKWKQPEKTGNVSRETLKKFSGFRIF